MARSVVMPSLGMFTSEGTLTDWLRPSGSIVNAGEPVAEITTEKATYQIEAPEAGRLHAAAPIGTVLQVQGILGYILAEGELPPVEMKPSGPGEVTTTSARSSSPVTVDRAAQGATVPPAGEIRATPIARKLAAQHAIDLRRLTGSGPGGRIVEADVVAAVERRDAASAATASPGQGPSAISQGRQVRQRLPLAGMRRTIAERLRHSLSTTVSVTLTREVDAEIFLGARQRLLERLGLVGNQLPYDALFVKILATALGERPELNAVIENDTILYLAEVHLGVAVSVPGGLVVPVVYNADAISLGDVAARIRDVSVRAREGQLKPADVGGATATITNLGAFGIDAFTPIINPPQSAILGIGRIQARPVIRGGQLAVGQTVVLSLTFDHRVADGVPAAQLLDVVARLMNDESYLESLA